MTPKKWRDYSPERDNLLLMLHAVHDEYRAQNYIPDQELAAIAQYLNMSLSELDGIISFYHLFSRQPRGKYVIRLCDSLSCRITGSLDIYYYLKKHLGLKNGETTTDKLFTLEIVNCLGSCDTAPNMMINDKLYKNVTKESLDKIFAELRAKEDKHATH